MDLEIFTITTAAILYGLAIIHAIFDGSSNHREIKNKKELVIKY